MLLTPACICLFIGAMGKSAQFPLHVWLPDSMEGPTPISALIHAATMVTAGIFMVARFSPLFELSDTALSFVIVIGAITALFMGFLGVIQNDIKRVVAYSTLSQLGYMTVALGASAYSAAIFHLMTHAFFKALLFLAAGSVIIGMHHDQDIRNMGGVKKYMPITWITSLIGSLALIGTPFFSGFYSKDSIIEAVGESHIAGSGFAYFAVVVSVFVTALYSFRMFFLVFHGRERFGLAHADHGSHGSADAHGAHASTSTATRAVAQDTSHAAARVFNDPHAHASHEAAVKLTTNEASASHDEIAQDQAHDDPHDEEHHGLGPGREAARDRPRHHDPADPARDPVARDRLLHDRADALRPLVRRRDRRRREPSRDGEARRGVPRRVRDGTARLRQPAVLARARGRRRRVVPVSREAGAPRSHRVEDGVALPAARQQVLHGPHQRDRVRGRGAASRSTACGGAATSR